MAGRANDASWPIGSSRPIGSTSVVASAPARAIAIAAILLATACLGRSPEVRHFVLGVEPLAQAERAAPDVSVLVGPVKLPAYLERPELARLRASGELELDAENRWLGGFEANFLRATSLGIAQRLGSTQVVTHPSKAPFPIEYTVRLHVDDLVAEADGGLRVRIRWALVGPAGRGTEPLEGPPPARLFTFEERVAEIGSSPEDRVRAHETVLAELATRIAVAIAEAEQGL